MPPTLFDRQLISGKFSVNTPHTHLWLLNSSDGAKKNEREKHTRRERKKRKDFVDYYYFTATLPLKKPLIKEIPQHRHYCCHTLQKVLQHRPE